MKFWNVYNIFFSLVLQELYRFVLFRSFYYIEVFVLFRSMYLYYFEFVVFKKIFLMKYTNHYNLCKLQFSPSPPRRSYNLYIPTYMLDTE